MESKTFRVPNIGCDACVGKIKAEIERLDGVAQVTGDPKTRVVTVEWQQPANWSLIERHLVEIDYPPGKA